MPEYLLPGVYMLEVESTPKPMEGVSNSTASLVGTNVIGELHRLANQIPHVVKEFHGIDPSTALLELMAWITDILVQRGDQIASEGYLPAARLAGAALALVKDCPQNNVLKRVRFFEGQLLETDDLRSQVNDKSKHELGWGIVCGLEIAVHNERGGPAVKVAPGCALDRRGREIVLGKPIELVLPHALKCVSVIARPTGRLAMARLLECEVLIVAESKDVTLFWVTWRSHLKAGES